MAWITEKEQRLVDALRQPKTGPIRGFELHGRNFRGVLFTKEIPGG